MNLFVLDTNPTVAAKSQINKHIVKMPSETANMLLWSLQMAGEPMPPNKQGEPVKLSHFNHPCSIWVRETSANYAWTLEHGYSLCYEYRRRYGKQHHALTYLAECNRWFRAANSWNGKDYQTPFARCFSNCIEAVQIPDTVEAYREFYWRDKWSFALWPDYLSVPEWWRKRALIVDNYIDTKNFIKGNHKSKLIARILTA